MTQRFWQMQWFGDSMLLFVAIIWGSSYVTAKFVLEEYPTYSFLFYRFLITVLIMLPFLGKELLRASRETWKIAGIFGLYLFGIFSLETWGVRYTSAANAGFIISLTIILTPLLEWMWSKNSVRPAFFAAVALSVCGTAFLTLQDGLSLHVGDWLILGAALLRSLQMITTKGMTQDKTLNSGSLTIIQLGVVALLSGLVSVSIDGVQALSVPFSWDFWGPTLYLAVFATFFAFYIQMIYIRRSSPSKVGLLMGTEPLFAAVFAIWMGGEALTIAKIAGGACILIGTYWGRREMEKSQPLSIGKSVAT